MATVVGVVFQPGGKVYSFDPAGLELRWDERVICQTSRGREYGRVVQTSHHLPDEELTARSSGSSAGPARPTRSRSGRTGSMPSAGMLLFREQAVPARARS